jgi:hypothetical protein
VTGQGPALDPRINAYLPELADARLRGQVDARHFAEGSLKRVTAAIAPLKRRPHAEAPLDSEVILGEVVRVFGDTPDGWTWCQCAADDYVGFVPSTALGDMEPEPTHRIVAVRTFVYPAPDLKMPQRGMLVAGARVALTGEEVRTRGTPYRLLAAGDGALPAVDVVEIAAPLPDDFVAEADRFVGTPYLWGGRTSLGLDCSGLVQLALGLTGRRAPRDADLQAASLGMPLEGVPEAELVRGDLCYWPGHALIVRDADTAIHCSGFHMRVVIEERTAAFARLVAIHGRPVVRRL